MKSLLILLLASIFIDGSFLSSLRPREEVLRILREHRKNKLNFEVNAEVDANQNYASSIESYSIDQTSTTQSPTTLIPSQSSILIFSSLSTLSSPNSVISSSDMVLKETNDITTNRPMPILDAKQETTSQVASESTNGVVEEINGENSTEDDFF